MKTIVTNIVNIVSEDEIDAGKLQEQFEVSTENGSKLNLPDSFETTFRPGLIRRAVHSSRANRRQPYGSRAHVGKRAPMAGMKFSVEWWGKGRGVARIMRKTGQRTGAQDPRTRQGRRAHGPKVEKDWSQKLNSKEKILARNSALAATTLPDLVSSRGHKFSGDLKLPLILGSYTEVTEEGKTTVDIEDISLKCATRKVHAIFTELGLGDDLNRAKNGRKIRAGKGKMRGRRYRTPKSLLLVVSSKGNLAKAVRNLPGVDVVSATDLSAEHLAPGGDAGRLTVFTEKSIEAMGVSN
jgi:large subunit ribosomal protein L4e|tara:strand:+ start:1320 stop:2207 length:888 start_codon:yes stop_codon:yes gene_type:complete